MTSRRSTAIVKEIQCNTEGTLRALDDIWIRIGFKEDQKAARANKVELHFRDLGDQMITEETALMDKLKQNIKEKSERIQNLTKALSFPKFEHHKKAGDGLMQVDAALNNQLAKLEKLVNQRHGELASLRAVEDDLCTQLCNTQYFIPKDSIPSEEQLNKLKEHIAMLTIEKSSRKKIVSDQKLMIFELYTELGINPDTSIGNELVDSDSDISFLTPTKMEDIKKLLDDLEFNKSESQIKRDRLWEKIKELWERLDVDSSERNIAENLYTGITSKDISGLTNTLQKLEMYKLENLQKLTESIRTDIVNLWGKCHYSAHQRRQFVAAHEENYTEDLLNTHELELKELEKYYNQNKDIFEGVNEWQNNFNLMKENEAKANDPDRLKSNRGGQLLKEERARKKIKTKLPKLENALFDKVEIWETEMNKPFLVEGVRFNTFVSAQWEDFERQKESQKQERMIKKKLEIEHEMTFGSTPKLKTPVKRRNDVTVRTPASNKKKRIGTVPSTPTNNGRSLCNPRYNTPGRKLISYRIEPTTSGRKPPSRKPPTGTPKSKAMTAVTQASPVTSPSSPAGHSTKSAPAYKSARNLNNTFSVTIVSDENSAMTTAPLQPDKEVKYNDFAAEITNNKSAKNMRSSAIGERRNAANKQS